MQVKVLLKKLDANLVIVGDCSFAKTDPKLWNALPLEVTSATSPL